MNDRFSKPQQYLGKVAAATLFSACKISNENRRIRDVINLYHMLIFSDDSDVGGAKDEHLTINCCNIPPLLDEEYWLFKEEIVKVEHHLLRILNFDVYSVSASPYRIVVTIVEELIKGYNDSSSDGTSIFNGKSNDVQPSHKDDTKVQIFKHLLNITWRRINDTLFDISTMTMKNSDVACGALQLAIEEIEKDNNTNVKIIEIIQSYSWWEWVDVDKGDINNAKAKLIGSTEFLSSF